MGKKTQKIQNTSGEWKQTPEKGHPGAGEGQGHLLLLGACAEWVGHVKTYLVQKNVIEKLEDKVPGGYHHVMVDNAYHILYYVSLDISVMIIDYLCTRRS